MKEKNMKKKSNEKFLEEEFDFENAKKHEGQDPKDTKVHRTLRIDADIHKWLTDQCKGTMNFSTLLNLKLRETMDRQNGVQDEVEILKRKLQLVEERIEKCEKAVHDKKTG